MRITISAFVPLARSAEEMTQTCVAVGNERLCKQLGDVPAFTDMKPNDFIVSNRPTSSSKNLLC